MGLKDSMLAAIALNVAFAPRVTAKSSDDEVLKVYDEMRASEAPQAQTLVAGVSLSDAPYQTIGADEALKSFRGKAITVQHAREVKVKGKDGIERKEMKTE